MPGGGHAVRCRVSAELVFACYGGPGEGRRDLDKRRKSRRIGCGAGDGFAMQLESDGHAMARKQNYVLAFIAGVLSIPVVFALASIALGRMVEAEYASGARTSTDGDTVTIPAAGITAAWVVALAIGVFLALAVRMLRRRRG